MPRVATRRHRHHHLYLPIMSEQNRKQISSAIHTGFVCFVSHIILSSFHHFSFFRTGSVSSLGSQGSVFGFFSNNHDDEKGRGDGSKGDFLKMLNPFSPKTAHHSPQQARSEFHRKNQDFLKQSASGRQKRQPPMVQHRRYVGCLPSWVMEKRHVLCCFLTCVPCLIVSKS